MSEPVAEIPVPPAPAPATPVEPIREVIETPPPSVPDVPASGGVVLRDENLGEMWPTVLEKATYDHMNLATWLPLARVVRVLDGVVHLELPAGQDTAKDIIEKPDNRDIIDNAIRSLTENCTGFRVELAEMKVDMPSAVVESGLPISEMINLQDGRKALEDPDLVKLVDVFKGRIVDIQHDVGGPESS